MLTVTFYRASSSIEIDDGAKVTRISLKDPLSSKKSPVGKKFEFGGDTYQVVAVTADHGHALDLSVKKVG
jgi:hypothetical protein